ncbi:DEAD/DEAH box helicase family protein [Thiocystis minor]|uniref:DEAD/DEAH box helicase family protein n=1 Tax=Thiocystis minor TaxID=61597 RepID=UPI001911BDC9|nr:DEAD/DEAH box helicase family protein [Thiocystis minor]
MSMNEAETRYHLIDPLLRAKGYVSRAQITLETILTPSPVEPTGAKGRRRKGPGRTDYLLCVQLDVMPKPLSIAVLESKREGEDPLAGMQQAKGYADGERFDVNDVFATNGHRYGEFDFVTRLQSGPFPFSDFPSHARLAARYAKDSGIDLAQPEAAILFQADSPAWALSRYYQDAAIRAAFEKIILCQLHHEQARVLLALATGAGKTIIATNYQTLGLDDDDGFASFLSEHDGDNAFSVIIIDECHRSAWGRWSEALRRNPDAIHIGLTATPRQLHEAKNAPAEDRDITANNRRYFGEPVYEYTLIQAQEDGYLAACEIVKRKASIDSATFTRAAICNRPSSFTRWSGAARASMKRRRNTSSGSTTTPMSPACSAPT